MNPRSHIDAPRFKIAEDAGKKQDKKWTGHFHLQTEGIETIKEKDNER